MSELITLHVNEDQSITIPAEIRRRLQPGATLTVEDQENGTFRLRFDDAPEQPNPTVESPEQEGPRLVKEGKALVLAGKVEEGFDWDSFMSEHREAPLHSWEPSDNAASL